MNVKTKIVFDLTRIYEYAKDLLEIYTLQKDNNSDKILLSVKYSINMCIQQIGEYVIRISYLQDENHISIVDQEVIPFKKIKGLRNRIVHTYDTVDQRIIAEIVENDIPNIIHYIENFVDKSVLKDPYILYENEYDDLVK